MWNGCVFTPGPKNRVEQTRVSISHCRQHIFGRVNDHGDYGGINGQSVMVGAADGFALVCHVGTKKILASLRRYEFPANHVMSNNADDEEDGAELSSSVEAVDFASIAVNPSWCATGGAHGALKVRDFTTDREDMVDKCVDHLQHHHRLIRLRKA